MGDSLKNFDADKLFSYSVDLVKVLKDNRDISNLTQCLENFKSLSSSCDIDYNEARSLLEDYEKKIDASTKKTEEAKSGVVDDAELDLLQRELEEELGKERLLEEELRGINNEFSDLDRQRISVQEQKKTLHKHEKDEQRAEMVLSTCASVTEVIPNLDDQSKISGYIVDKDKNVVEKFEFDSSKMTAPDVCNAIWRMLDP